MPHDLEIRDGVASFAYAIREGVRLPWHGLGVSHEGLMTVEESLGLSRVGGLLVSKFQHTLNGVECGTFGVQRHDVTVKLPCKTCSACISMVAVGEERPACLSPRDTGLPSPMSGVTVGAEYCIIQYADTIRNFATAAYGAESRPVDTMGLLANGNRMFTTFLGETVDIRAGDPITTYNILTSSHDGTGVVLWFSSDTRVVCQNTLRVAIAGMVNETRIRHTKNAGEYVATATKALYNAKTVRDERVRAFKVMGNREVTVAEFNSFLDAYCGKLDEGEDKGRKFTHRERLQSLFEGAGKGAGVAGKTAWGIFQAVTQDQDEGARGKQPWLTSLLNGTQNDHRQKAFDYLLALCEGKELEIASS
jgi:Domain of unknown function (DUF932)